MIVLNSLLNKYIIYTITKIQFSIAENATSTSPEAESNTGYGTNTINCSKTFTEAGTYNVFI